MKLGILVLSIGNFGKKGYYNLQEVGLGKELDNYFNKVTIYKLVSLDNKKEISKVENTKNTYIKSIPSKKIGTNGLIDTNNLDKDIDALICFSDTQIFFPKVYKWCLKNNIILYPYIGVVESNSTNIIKKSIINILFKRNLKYYKKCSCFVKTTDVGNKLKTLGVNNIYLIPVGLNVDLLKSDYKKYDSNKIKKEFHIKESDKILLFVGRLTEQKNPLTMIDILKDLISKDNSYKLIMVGNGHLKEEIEKKIISLNLKDYVTLIDKIENKDIWKLYKIANYFINLSFSEIFGMAILEAMYYDVTTIAYHAPGPNLIIKNNISGFVVNSKEEIKNIILQDKQIKAHDYILENFTWKKSACMINTIIKGDKK